MKSLITKILVISISQIFTNSFIIKGQDLYYWSAGTKQILTEYPGKYIIMLDKNGNSDVIERNLRLNSGVKSLFKLKENLKIIITESMSINELTQKDGIEKVMPTYRLGNNPLYLTGQILLQPKQGISIEKIVALVDTKITLINKTKYNTYIFEIIDWDKILSVANKIYESGLVEYCQPNIITPILRSQISDPKYTEQYYLNNTGQFAGTSGIDINAPEAWELTTGRCPITIAIIDDGVEAHEDLGGDIDAGFTPQFSNENPDTDGAPNENDPPSTTFPYDNDSPFGHGESCAGIIAASHNSLGIRGIAPDVTIVPINIFNDWFIDQIFYQGQWYDFVNFREDLQDIANAIDFAWDDAHADIISNSWNFTAQGFTSDVIIAAINRARTQGRNINNQTYGSVVVFSSGNENLNWSGVCFPANVNGVITVGAVDNDGNIWDYSSRGPQIDLVAPSGGSPGNIRTIDREGNAGFVSGNYYNEFSGTSAACPQVAGVIALLLSIEPRRTEAGILTVLQQTATDMGSAGFDNTFGFGRVNGYEAIHSIYPYISGQSPLCSSGHNFSIINLPTNDSFTWNSSANITRNCDQGSTPCFFQGNDWGGSGSITATINLNGCNQISLTIPVWAGRPWAPILYPSGFPPVVMGIYSPKDIVILESPGAELWDANWSSSGSITTEWSYGQTGRFYSISPGTGYFFATPFNLCGDGVMYQGEVWVDDGMMEKMSLEIDFTLSPNPATDYVDLKLTNNMEKAYSVQFIDSYSRIIMDEFLTGTQNRINIQSLMKGNYLIRVLYEKKSITKTLIVQ